MTNPAHEAARAELVRLADVRARMPYGFTQRHTVLKQMQAIMDEHPGLRKRPDVVCSCGAPAELKLVDGILTNV